MTSTTITVDAMGRGVLIAALDLYQRVAMGQWRDVVEVADELFDEEHSGFFGPAADAVIQARCLFAKDPALRHPGASLGIRRASAQARVAYDLWHAIGGGMRSRASDRLTDVSVSVSPDPWTLDGGSSCGAVNSE